MSEKIAKGGKLTEQDVMSVLRDDVDLIAKEVAKELVSMMPDETPMKNELKKWDGSFGVDTSTSTFYSTFLAIFYHNLLNSTDVDPVYGWDMFDKRADPRFFLNFI